MRPDPFALKSYPKWHPRRLLGTARIRLEERISRRSFDQYVIPQKRPEGLMTAPDADWKNTNVTPDQAGHLLTALKETEGFANTAVVEIGSFRGVTTRYLAQNTARQFFAVDPFIGYGGSDSDYEIFKKNTADLPNVTHLRQISSTARAQWKNGGVSFVFIDAVHDYANSAFDRDAWSSLVIPGGMVAMHDVDIRGFAGTRRAAFEGLQTMDLYAHVDNLVILQKRSGD